MSALSWRTGATGSTRWRSGSDTISFGWKAPCNVPVRAFKYRSDKGSSITRMHLVFDAREDGYQVRLEGLEFEMLNGQAIDTPQLRAQVRDAIALVTASMPRFLISSDARYVGTVGMEEMVATLMESLGDDVAPRVAEMMRQPEMLQQLEQVSGDYWWAWVEMWDAQTLKPGAKKATPQQLPAFGETFTADTVLEHLGTLEGAPNLRLLRLRSLLEGDRATELMQRQVETLAQRAGAPAPPKSAIQSMRRVIDLYAAIDPNGAFPHHTRRETLTEVNDRRRLEIEEWAFDWERAQGCR